MTARPAPSSEPGRAGVIRTLAATPADIALGTTLVREYVVATAEELGHDVDLILTFVPDLRDFAGRYLRGGAFLVADEQDTTAAGVGVTPGPDGVCEMNRLWVRPAHRGRGLARTLGEAALAQARALGFTRMILDVAPSRTVPIALYRSLGFTETAPAHEYPFPMVFLGRDL